jgi:hypothetical protein
MIRASFKGYDNKVQQYNYVLPISSPKFLMAVQARLGRQQHEQLISSDELLENPIVQDIDQPIELAAQHFDNLLGAALLEVSVGDSAVRMIKKAIEGRREAWQFITSENNADIHQELKAAIERVALMPADMRDQGMRAVRTGYWKELKDRFQGKKIDAQGGSILISAASRAVVDADVFIACGSTVRATEFSNSADQSVGVFERAQQVKDLLEKVRGNGSCGGCGAKGKLFGCGLCSSCNKKWCEIYVRTGKQTDIKDLAYLRYARPDEDSSTNTSETFGQYWERIRREIKQKREIKKVKEEAIKLEDEQRLTQAA